MRYLPAFRIRRSSLPAWNVRKETFPLFREQGARPVEGFRESRIKMALKQPAAPVGHILHHSMHANLVDHLDHSLELLRARHNIAVRLQQGSIEPAAVEFGADELIKRPFDNVREEIPVIERDDERMYGAAVGLPAGIRGGWSCAWAASPIAVGRASCQQRV